MSGLSAMKVIAGLHRPVEAETPYGGRVVNYEPVGSIWLALGARRRRERTEGGVTRGVETLAATTRADERLEPGLVVRFGGADWRIAADGVRTVSLGVVFADVFRSPDLRRAWAVMRVRAVTEEI